MSRRDLVNVAANQDPYSVALRSSEIADAALRSLTTKVRQGLAVLFGDAIPDALWRDLERAHDGHVDSRDRFIDACASKQDEIDTLKRRLAGTQGVLLTAASELQRRYTRGRKPIPDGLMEIVQVAGAQWPHLYLPSDPRHEHDLDAGGACRNPSCRYIGAADTEPF